MQSPNVTNELLLDDGKQTLGPKTFTIALSNPFLLRLHPVTSVITSCEQAAFQGLLWSASPCRSQPHRGKPSPCYICSHHPQTRANQTICSPIPGLGLESQNLQGWKRPGRSSSPTILQRSPHAIKHEGKSTSASLCTEKHSRRFQQ